MGFGRAVGPGGMLLASGTDGARSTRKAAIHAPVESCSQSPAALRATMVKGVPGFAPPATA